MPPSASSNRPRRSAGLIDDPRLSLDVGLTAGKQIIDRAAASAQLALEHIEALAADHGAGGKAGDRFRRRIGVGHGFLRIKGDHPFPDAFHDGAAMRRRQRQKAAGGLRP